MSTQVVETILSRAMNDVAFAESLFTDPEKAVAGLDLTNEELGSIKTIARAQFGQPAAAPEERKSMAMSPGRNHNQSML